MRIYSITPIVQNKQPNKPSTLQSKQGLSINFKQGPLLEKKLLNEFYELGLNNNFISKYSEKLKDIPIEKFKLFFKIFNDYEDTTSSKVVDLHEIFKDSNVDIDSYTNLITRLKEEKVSCSYFDRLLTLGRNKETTPSYISHNPAYFMNVYINYDEIKGKKSNSKTLEEIKTDFTKINDFLDFRLKALKHKNLLARYGQKITNLDIDEVLIEKPHFTQITRGILGDDALIYSFKEKKDNVIDYINLIGSFGQEKDLQESLKVITNPYKSEYYEYLDDKIKCLKSKFKQADSQIELEKIKSEINTKTKEKYQIIKDSIKDPKEILEKTLIIASLYNAIPESNIGKFIKLAKDKDTTDFNNALEEKLYNIYNVEVPKNEVLKKLNFKDSKHFPKLFSSRSEFKLAFKKLIELINEHPEKSNLEIFNELPHNKKTKDDFEKILGIDYNKWTEYDPESHLILGRGDNTIKFQKADMNNIVHSLFLGEDASCCTKINGLFGLSSVSYILAKMIQCIEVYHNDIPVGNTMCYFALVDSKPSLILDNIELKKQYSNDKLITDGIYAYAIQMLEELGHPEFPIFLSGKINDINTENLDTGFYNIKLIGDSGNNPIYIDYKVKTMLINDDTREKECVKLYKITKNCPDPKSSNKIDSDTSSIILEDHQSDFILYEYTR